MGHTIHDIAKMAGVCMGAVSRVINGKDRVHHETPRRIQEIIERGFTLIELLIVVAIIAILAAIAVPNFLEAQVRAKVSRVKSDLRTVSIALESYAIDNNAKYPDTRGAWRWDPTSQITRGSLADALPLSTPVAYLSTTYFLDPFCKTRYYDQFLWTSLQGGTGQTGRFQACYIYINTPMTMGKNWKSDRPAWWLCSYGPDYVNGPDPRGIIANFSPTNYATLIDPQGGHTWDIGQYDSTNGTISGGDIMRHQ